jgi:hypothetical protein
MSKKGPRNDLEYPNRSELGRRRKGSHRNNRHRPCLSRIQGVEEGGEMTINQMLAIVGALAIITMVAMVVWYVKLASLKRMVKRSNRHRNE